MRCFIVISFLSAIILNADLVENNFVNSSQCDKQTKLIIDNLEWSKVCQQSENENCVLWNAKSSQAICSLSVTHLTFNVSSVQTIPYWIFQEIPNVINFEMVNHNISSILGRHFRFATNLQVLNLTENNLIEFPTASTLFNLKYLNLSRNSLISISNLTNFRSLLELDVSYNLIDSLDQNALASMYSLQKLIIRGNRLKQFSVEQLNHIKYFDISHNQLIIFQINNTLPEIENLLLDGNNDLIISDAYLKAKAPKLKNLHIQNTKYECNPFLSSPNIMTLDNLSVIERINTDLTKSINITANFNNGTCQYTDQKKIEDLDKRISNMEKQLNKAVRILETLHYKITGYRFNSNH